MSNERVLRASEIGAYVYCQRAWWLGHVEGEDSQNVAVMEAGTRTHAQHGVRVAFSRLLMALGYAAFAIVLLLLLIRIAN